MLAQNHHQKGTGMYCLYHRPVHYNSQDMSPSFSPSGYRELNHLYSAWKIVHQEELDQNVQ